MDYYLNIFSYQTFGFQQFSGSFINWSKVTREFYRGKKNIIDQNNDKIIVDIKDQTIYGATENIKINTAVKQNDINVSIKSEKINVNKD